MSYSNSSNIDGSIPARGGKILVLPGDHIGPEVVTEALKVLDIIEESSGVKFERDFDLCGGCSLDKHKDSVTEAVLQKSAEADAVFFGSAGGPEWGTVQPNPESGLLRIRTRMQVRTTLPSSLLARGAETREWSADLILWSDFCQPPTLQISI